MVNPDFDALVEHGVRRALGSRNIPASDEQVAEVVGRLHAAAERGDVAGVLWLQKMADKAATFLTEEYLAAAGVTGTDTDD